MNSVGQLLLVGLPGPELDLETARLLRDVQPGGFIIFGRNIQTATQLRKLLDDLREISAVEPIITIDQEGGRVSRLKLLGQEPPNAQQLRARHDLELIQRHGRTTGRLLRIFGFNLDLCPVLDISFDDEADNSLRGRCWGNEVGEVIRNAAAFNSALRGEGITSCGKHFPGYSAAEIDAHHELPVLERSRAQLDAEELAVFQRFVGEVDSFMICHAMYPHLDAKLPASLSPAIIQGLLREEFGFKGLVMTDDLDMGAIVNHYGLADAVRLAIEAGNDLAMICHRIEGAAEAKSVLEKLPAGQVEAALNRLAAYKKKLAPPDAFSEEEFRRRDAEVGQLRVDTLGADAAAQRSPEDGKRSPVEIY